MTRLRALAAEMGVVNAGVAVLLAILSAMAFRTTDAWLAWSIAAAAGSVAIMPPVDGWTFRRVRR